MAFKRTTGVMCSDSRKKPCFDVRQFADRMKEVFACDNGPGGNYENSKCIKSITPCGGKQNDKQRLVFWCVGARLARVAAGSIGTSHIFFCPCYWESKLVLKTYLTPLI